MNDPKLRAKLVETIHKNFDNWSMGPEHRCEMVADAILQAPDLRIELAPKAYFAIGALDFENNCVYLRGKDCPVLVAKFYGDGSRVRSEEYATWLNSKEPA